jgi:hypothetical protein
MVAGYRLGNRSSIPSRCKEFLLRHRSVHPASYRMNMGGGGSLSVGNAPVTHLHLTLSSGMWGTTPPLPQHVFMAWCLGTETTLPFSYMLEIALLGLPICINCVTPKDE